MRYVVLTVGVALFWTLSIRVQEESRKPSEWDRKIVELFAKDQEIRNR